MLVKCSKSACASSWQYIYLTSPSAFIAYHQFHRNEKKSPMHLSTLMSLPGTIEHTRYRLHTRLVTLTWQVNAKKDLSYIDGILPKGPYLPCRVSIFIFFFFSFYLITTTPLRDVPGNARDEAGYYSHTCSFDVSVLTSGVGVDIRCHIFDEGL